MPQSSRVFCICIIGCNFLTALFVQFSAARAESNETVLYTFKDGSDGGDPYSNLILDQSGNLYGTTRDGGSQNCARGCGTVFEVMPDGTEKVLHAFQGGSGDGASPYAGLVSDQSSNLYGTTTRGGAQDDGVVFKLAPDGTETVLHSFGAYDGDGANPYSGLAFGETGALWGSTIAGGLDDLGTIFMLSSKGWEQVHSYFTGGNDGAYPEAALVVQSTARPYGTTTAGGGSGCGGSGCGTIFRLANKEEKVVYAFKGGNDGAAPAGSLIADSKGNLYGTTVHGGDSYSCGTVFKITSRGKETVLLTVSDLGGCEPMGSLVADGAGNLYGTTAYGGTDALGNVFEITKRGKAKVIYTFKGFQYSDGSNPQAGLVMDAAGNLYGTTLSGGNTGCEWNHEVACGTVFKIAHQE